MGTKLSKLIVEFNIFILTTRVSLDPMQTVAKLTPNAKNDKASLVDYFGRLLGRQIGRLLPRRSRWHLEQNRSWCFLNCDLSTADRLS